MQQAILPPRLVTSINIARHPFHVTSPLLPLLLTKMHTTPCLTLGLTSQSASVQSHLRTTPVQAAHPINYSSHANLPLLTALRSHTLWLIFSTPSPPTQPQLQACFLLEVQPQATPSISLFFLAKHQTPTNCYLLYSNPNLHSFFSLYSL